MKKKPNGMLKTLNNAFGNNLNKVFGKNSPSNKMTKVEIRV